MLKRLKMLGAAAFAAVLMAAPAQAATVVDFGTGLAAEGGSISWNGSTLVGSNIPIGRVTITEAPTNNGAYIVTGGATAANGGFYGALNFNTSPNNNFINIMGCISALGIGMVNGVCSPVALMSGSFTSTDGSGPNGLLNGFGIDTKNADLLRAIGLSPTTPFSLLGFSLSTQTLNPNGTPGTAISTDIRNTAVPEPATMMLLGTGLLAAFRARRRQA